MQEPHYDNGFLHEVTDQLDGVTTYTYKDNGLVDTITYPNGTKAIHTYNSRNWLTCISSQKSDDMVIAQFDYTYDSTYWGKNGTRTRVIENILKPDGNRISAQVDYEYDDLYRLVHEHRIAYNGGDPGVAYEYNFAYDDAGNRTSWQTVGGSTITYTYDAANKMTSPGTFTYDDKGNTLTHTASSITTTYTWDYLNRLTQWQKTGETTQAYVYNADGMRVRKTPSGGTATEFLLDGGEIAEEMAGTEVTSYVGPRGGTTGSISASSLLVYHADRMGTVRVMSGDAGSVVALGVYDSFGNELTTVGEMEPFGFGGQHRYFTDSTGLHYLKARYYDPATGRFISRAPARYGSNHYEYARNAPTVMVDPLGLFPGLVGCVGGGFIGVIGGIIGNHSTTIGENICNGFLGCAVGAATELMIEAFPEIGTEIAKCAIGAGGAFFGGMGAGNLCHQLFNPKCGGPINWKCTLVTSLVSAVGGCLGGLADDPAMGGAVGFLFEGLSMLGGSACNNIDKW